MKNMDNTAKPFVARVYKSSSAVVRYMFSSVSFTYNDPVIPGENGKLIQTSDEIPARSYVASKEYAKREDGDGVHEVMRACQSTTTLRLLVLAAQSWSSQSTRLGRVKVCDLASDAIDVASVSWTRVEISKRKPWAWT